ncbi:HAD family hydrolase [Olsenella massiliensis]|uniref:HAD family hydrolase n=1 Tax=Olsenella massiliensis TaxID=1622075 RepID=UPI00071CC109|nr:HAD family hydrolase [Olsenella massiliensis]
MAHDIKLILTDIDGTILPYGQPEVSERCVAAFHAAMDAGIHIGPASGRGHKWLPPLLRGDESCCADALASNGMEVYLDGERIHVETLDHGVLGRLAKVLATMDGTGLVCFDDQTPVLVQGSLDDLTACFPSYGSRAVVADAVPACEIVKANVFFDGTLAQMHDLAGRLHDLVPTLDFDVPQPGWLNILTNGWGKGPAIDVLCHHLGIDVGQVAVFGDGGNDVSMLSYVPVSFAVEGAAPDAWEAATYHLGRCEDEAAVQMIEALAAGETPYLHA